MLCRFYLVGGIIMNNELPQPIDSTVWFKPKIQDDILIEGIASGN